MLLFSVGNAAMNAPRYGNAAMNAPRYGNATMNAPRYGNGTWMLRAVGNFAKNVLRSLAASTITPCFPIPTARCISFPRWQFVSELPTAVLGVAESLKGSCRMRTGRTLKTSAPLFLVKTFQMGLIFELDLSRWRYLNTVMWIRNRSD